MKNALNTTRESNFPDWYQEIIQKADLAENSLTRGAMVIKPYGYAIWEIIKNILDKKIKNEGVLNASFPALIPVELFEKEAEHVSGFSKESAVITHHRLVEKDGKLLPDGKLEKPYILRPTSETIIGESFSKWIKSYRDLPLKINQWCNVFRWEMRPRLFLRTSEFFWQEGHCVFKNEEEAEDNAKTMLNVYDDVLRNYLAIYGITGTKTENEKFAGAKKTYTIESMMQDGKALQSCTSHNLGQNFAIASNIKYIDEKQKEQYCWTTSWGFSTRVIGALIMSHSDDDGLVLPPQIAPYQIVIIPIIHNEEKKDKILNYCNKIKNTISNKYRIFIDSSYETPQNKKWNWIRKGAPIKIEIGERDIETNSIFFSIRNKFQEKISLQFNEFIQKIDIILNELHNDLLKNTENNLLNNTIIVNSFEELKNNFDIKNKFYEIPLNLFNNNKLLEFMDKNSMSFRCIPSNKKNKVIIAKSY